MERRTEEEQQVLDYFIDRPSPLKIRDPREYYREPPVWSTIRADHVVVWFVGFLIGVAAVVGLFAYWFNRVWR